MITVGTIRGQVRFELRFVYKEFEFKFKIKLIKL